MPYTTKTCSRTYFTLDKEAILRQTRLFFVAPCAEKRLFFQEESMSIAIERVRAEDLFVTKMFRESKWAQGIYGGLDLFVTDDKMLPGHFGTYFGAVTRRKYDNPYVQDLYHLHECVHVNTLGPNPAHTFMEWSRRMVASETEASLVSECFVYLRMPELRELTFKHEIWVDRFERMSLLPEAKEREVRRRRHRALRAPENDDYIEHQIWNYGQQNVQWCRIWADKVDYGPFADKPAFRVVEEHMSRPDWRDRHAEWLEQVSAMYKSSASFSAERPVPFLQQAKAFAPFYHETNRLYGNHVLER